MVADLTIRLVVGQYTIERCGDGMSVSKVEVVDDRYVKVKVELRSCCHFCACTRQESEVALIWGRLK